MYSYSEDSYLSLHLSLRNSHLTDEIIMSFIVADISVEPLQNRNCVHSSCTVAQLSQHRGVLCQQIQSYAFVQIVVKRKQVTWSMTLSKSLKLISTRSNI